jgi:hypothetical protein
VEAPALGLRLCSIWESIGNEVFDSVQATGRQGIKRKREGEVGGGK